MDFLDRLLAPVLEAAPGVARALAAHGAQGLARYVLRLCAPGPPALQSRDDFLEEASSRAGRLLGPAAARGLAERLEALPAALTANHHGADFQSQSVQGTLLLALPALLGLTPHRAVPVLACGGAPMSSFSFPRGALLARRPDPEPGGVAWPAPLKVPVFAWKTRYTLVLAAAGLTRDLVDKALALAGDLAGSGAMGAAEGRALSRILAEDFGSPEVLARERYSDQSTLLSARVWNRLFADEAARAGTSLASLELEGLSGALLARDAENPHSLLHPVLFDPRVRGLALESLNRVQGCWDLAKLAELGAAGQAPAGNEALRGSGTALFWGLDAKGRRAPLALCGEGGRAWLRGVGLSGERLEVELAPVPLREALAAGRVFPGLFAAYAPLALARGVRCLGGVFQCDYLPAMRDGLAAALAAAGERERAAAVAAAPAGEFLAGPEALLAEYPGGGLAPAGPVEVLACGGLGARDLEQAAGLSLDRALRIGLFELYPEFIPEARREPGWRRGLGAALLAPGAAAPARLAIPD